jgi:lipopolysaccharide/colanic/teichoic acid biosynthesis glycosyltransferase
MPRTFEFILALVGLLVLGPLFLLIALCIKLDSGGPVFYRAVRAGKGDSRFTMLKFRTMVSGASRQGPPITTLNDPRITKVGSFLRKTKLDELPQLMNVLKGSMGFVGPRPEDPEIVKKYSSSQKRILRYCPGITSPASIAFREEETLIPASGWEEAYRHDILPKKLDMDIRYFERATCISDLKVIMKTIFKTP